MEEQSCPRLAMRQALQGPSRAQVHGLRPADPWTLRKPRGSPWKGHEGLQVSRTSQPPRPSLRAARFPSVA